MGEFFPILQLMVFVFFALQLERINFSLKQISKSLHHLSDRMDIQSSSSSKDENK